MDREIKLAVRNLKISFRTDGGKVQAVRDIDFDLYKGETLAIVGESGSGKSVTSRAVLGILANNVIKEGGEILYDGRDLMKITEEEFCKIRGDKIAMIFQDPLSSLNPIMRIGKQMTEAMLIKGKHNQATCRKDFNAMLAELNAAMDSTVTEPSDKERNDSMCKKFNEFEVKHLELENAFNTAKENCLEALSSIDDVLFRIEKKAMARLRGDVKVIMSRAARTVNDYVVSTRADELKAELEKLKGIIKMSPVTKVTNFFKSVTRRDAKLKDETDYAACAESLGKIKDILAEAAAKDEPNFFSMGYYLTFSGRPLPDMTVNELNEFTHKYLDDNFMLSFIALTKEAIKASHARSLERKQAAVELLKQKMPLFESELDKSTATATMKEIVAAVEAAIDKLDTVKDNIAYTFSSSLKAGIDLYFNGIESNMSEEKRFARQTAGYEAKVAKGKTPSWKVADKNLVDLVEARDDIRALLNRIIDKYNADIAAAPSVDYDARAVAMIDYLKEKASGVAFKVTRGMAKERALKLMEEVGIPEPRKRFRQYPFELSGGMRQRIVIAIALSANPDILICDEPTTALDVTIQSQILELINRVKTERQLSVIFITHDLGVVANMADRIAVMYAGKIVEIGTDHDVFYDPRHPYTWALLSSMPDLDTKEKLEAIPGTPPNMIYPPKGDAFADRNKYAMQIDFEEQPPMFRVSDTHCAATWLLHPNAPKVDPPKTVTDRIKRALAAINGDAEAKPEAKAEAEVKAAEAETAEAKPEGEGEGVKAKAKKAPAKKPTAKKAEAESAKPAAKKAPAKKPATKKDNGGN